MHDCRHTSVFDGHALERALRGTVQEIVLRLALHLVAVDIRLHTRQNRIEKRCLVDRCHKSRWGAGQQMHTVAVDQHFGRERPVGRREHVFLALAHHQLEQHHAVACDAAGANLLQVVGDALQQLARPHHGVFLAARLLRLVKEHVPSRLLGLLLLCASSATTSGWKYLGERGASRYNSTCASISCLGAWHDGTFLPWRSAAMLSKSATISGKRVFLTATVSSMTSNALSSTRCPCSSTQICDRVTAAKSHAASLPWPHRA